MEHYLLVKNIHVVTVILSITGFLTRTYWRFFTPHRLQWRFTRILPHIIDSLLLASAVILTLILHQYPFVHHWLTAKVLLLIVYIISGSFTLKTRYSKKVSLVALLIAVSSFASIVLIAHYRLIEIPA